jgi:aldose sugar dehydrogenase
MKKICLKTIIFLAFCPFLNAQSNLKTRTIATGLDTPWEIIWGPDNHIWVTERFGRISRINPTTGVITPLLTISEVRENGEGGLLGMALDTVGLNNLPNVYVAYDYTAANGNYREKIVSYQYNGTTLINPTIILDNIAAANIHNGCRLVISPDRKLFISTGDAATVSTSQNTASLNGKILRVNLNGTIPADNPIKDSPVWSWGHRNAQGLVYSTVFNQMYSSEHGQNIEDELNIIQKARNYGWVTVEGACNLAAEQTFCRDSNIVEPIAGWSPPLGVAGIDFYSHNLIPEWKNSILMASLRGARLTVIKLNANGLQAVSKTDFYTNTYGRLRDVCISPDGKVYLAVSNKDTRGLPQPDDDKIIEISAATSAVKDIQQTVRIFPNPVSNILTLESELAFSKIQLYDSIGRLVTDIKGSNRLDLSAYTEGGYFITILDEKGVIISCQKIVKY